MGGTFNTSLVCLKRGQRWIEREREREREGRKEGKSQEEKTETEERE